MGVLVWYTWGMAYRALLEYIRSAKTCGASDIEITEQLHKAGWYRVDIQDALDLYRRLIAREEAMRCDVAPTAPAPSVTERLIPRHYDPQLIAIAAISFALGFIGYLVLAN